MNRQFSHRQLLTTAFGDKGKLRDGEKRLACRALKLR